MLLPRNGPSGGEEGGVGMVEEKPSRMAKAQVKPSGVLDLLGQELAELCEIGFGTLEIRVHNHVVTEYKFLKAQQVDKELIRNRLEPFVQNRGDVS